MKILIIEDNEDHLELIEECCFEAFSEQCHIETQATLSDGLYALKTKPFDVALVDLSFPDSTINETTAKLSNFETPIPIIVLTSIHDNDLGQRLISEGAQDFLPKDILNTTLLQRMVNYAIERKRNQVELEEKSIDQETFCRSLSHDFKAPIRNVSQLSGMLKSQLNKREVLLESDLDLFDKIETRLEVMRALVDGLYDYIRSEHVSSSNRTIDLNSIVSELSELLKADSDKEIVIKSDELPSIQGEQTQVFMMMQNILQNAIKYCTTDPVIEISAQKIEQGSDSGDTLVHEIQIKDNGIGIDERFLETIFEPFRRLHSDTEYLGSGLGLSVVKRIVSNHRGTISISSIVGEGTCITLQFP